METKHNVRIVHVVHTVKVPEYSLPQEKANLRRELDEGHEAAETEIADLLDNGYEVMNLVASNEMVHVLLVKRPELSDKLNFGLPKYGGE